MSFKIAHYLAARRLTNPARLAYNATTAPLAMHSAPWDELPPPLFTLLNLPMPAPEEEIYQEHVMDHYEDPYHRGHCLDPSHAHEDDNPLCGDVVRIELKIDGEGKLREAWFDGDGCCISQASASMLVEQVEGKTVAEVKQFTASHMLDLFGARLTPNRQKCCLLSWRVLQQAVHAPLNETQP